MEPQDVALSTMNAVLNTNRVITEAMEKRLRAEAGLSLAQYEVLLRLNDAPDARLRMVDITRQLRVSKSGVTQLVDRLEGLGLVIRESCLSDRRLTYAKLTERGAEALRRGAPACHPVVQEHFARHLSEQDMACVRTALAKVLEGNGYPGEQPCLTSLEAPSAAPQARRPRARQRLETVVEAPSDAPQARRPRARQRLETVVEAPSHGRRGAR